jgi:hypothetical protein
MVVGLKKPFLGRADKSTNTAHENHEIAGS